MRAQRVPSVTQVRNLSRYGISTEDDRDRFFGGVWFRFEEGKFLNLQISSVQDEGYISVCMLGYRNIFSQYRTFVLFKSA